VPKCANVGVPMDPGFCFICVTCVIHAKKRLISYVWPNSFCVIDQVICVIGQSFASFEKIDSASIFIAFPS
jgi:hypothetical protein